MNVVASVRPRLSAVSWPRLLATGLFGLTVAAIVVNLILWAGQHFRPPPVSFIRGQGVLVMEMFMAVSYSAMGWLLAHRVTRNPLGWLFLAIGVGTAVQMTGTFLVQEGHEAFRPLDGGELASAWFASTLYLPLVVALFVLVFLLFPDGRPLSRRWGRAGLLAGLGAGAMIVSAGLSPDGLMWYPSLPNPLAAPSALRPLLVVSGLVGLILLVAGVLTSTASLVLRYRRTDEVERAQLRWIAAAVLLLAGGGLPFVISRYALRLDYGSGELLLMVAVAAGCFLPIAAAVAVLHHRLYDIDVIIGRALVYIPLTGILGGLYTAGVATFQRVFVILTGDRSDAAIIITTLVLASMFTPIRNWLQAMVDRRFKPGHGAGSPGAAHGSLDELSARVANLEQLLGQRPAPDVAPAANPAALETRPMQADGRGL